MRILAFILILLISCGVPKTDKLTLFKPKKNTAQVGLKSLSTIMEVDTAVLKQLVSNKSESLEVSLPYNGSKIDLVLTKQDLYTPDFVVRTEHNIFSYNKGISYTGKIKGVDSSLVTLNLFQEELNGVVASPQLGELNLGKVSEISLEYMLSDPSLVDTFTFRCDEVTTPALDSLRASVEAQIKNQVKIQGIPCVSVDFELSYNLYTQLGGVIGATNFITSVFSTTKALFKVEGIEVSIKSVFVWTVPDGYATDQLSALNQLRTKRVNDPGFTGTFVQLIQIQSGNGGIAYLGPVACGGMRAYRFSVAAIQPIMSGNTVYNWNVEVITHELGHNMGSHHTHWCGWQGGPIDNCYTAEGACTPGPTPCQGCGTIMSYCHLTAIGIRFPNGFGPQPGNAIRAGTACSICTTPPPPPAPSCTDGIKNGTETGIDCGGGCPPCAIVSVPISQGKPAKMSSQYLANTNNYPASMGNDGIISINNFFHTGAEVFPWWEVDLGTNIKLSSFRIVNRQGCCQDRITDFKIFISSSPLTTMPISGWAYKHDGSQFNELVKPILGTGRYVRLWAEQPKARYLNLSEVQFFGTTGVIVCDTIKIPVITYRDSISCK